MNGKVFSLLDKTGTTCFMDSSRLKSYLEEKRAQVEQTLDRLLPKVEEEPRVIHESMRYIGFAGGKRLRPILAISAYKIAGHQDDFILSPACGLELIHTYSLIHDDLPCMDDDDLRRGRPTNHKVFGEGIAVLAGDALLTEAFALVAQSKPPKRYPVRLLVKELAFAAGSLRLIAGQVQDLENENRQAILDEVKQTHLNKTA